MAARTSFREQLDALQRDLLRMGVFVSEAVERSVLSLAKADLEMAQAVIAGDHLVNQMMIDIEKRCLQLMALQQPMAGDLRAIGTILKIVTDLERMADHATDIAKITLRLEGEPLVKQLIHIPYMGRLAQEMIREALEAYLNHDQDRARKMIAMDDQVDGAYRVTFDEMLAIMQTQPENVRQATYLLLVALYLERIGDHATNLGEWTIYLVTGELEDMNQ